MKLTVQVEMKMVLYNKNNMEPLIVENKIEQSWEEGSTEYKAVCEKYEGEIGKRTGTQKDLDQYDKKMLLLLSEEIKENMLESARVVLDVIKKSFTKQYDAYVEYAGYIINPTEFCACKVMPPRVRVVKE